MSFITYIVKCADGTLYIGSTDNLTKRIHQHNNLKSGARYTRQRRPVVLVHQEEFSTLREARSREYDMKQLERAAKFKLIKNKEAAFFTFLKKRGHRKNFLRYKEEARALVEERINYYKNVYPFSSNKIRIKNQKTRWGSCSKKGNLNFNYKIVHLPQRLADYIVVHELCHLAEFNHSKKFWHLVAQQIPDHRKIRIQLKQIALD